MAETLRYGQGGAESLVTSRRCLGSSDGVGKSQESGSVAVGCRGLLELGPNLGKT